ncbi:MAG: tail fiber protein [Pseudomonadota bacterium]
MGTPFMSELKLCAFNFAPKGWAQANGQFLPINQNQALFSLMGTTYGGNGQTTFALPDMRGRIPIHMGQGHALGERAGADSVTLNIQQLPQHLHFIQATTAAPTTNIPSSATLLSTTAPNDLYTGPGSGLGTMMPQAVSNVGGSQAHENRQPYLVLNWIVALQGVFPSQN